MISLSSSPWHHSVPVWFWLIVSYQARGILLVALGAVEHDWAYISLLDESPLMGLMVVILGIPAFMMEGLNSLRASWPTLLKVTVILMILALFVDIVLQGLEISPLLNSKTFWYSPVFFISLDILCVFALVGSPRLRLVFWARRWRWY